MIIKYTRGSDHNILDAKMSANMFPVLLLIDIQQAFCKANFGESNNPDLVALQQGLIENWRQHNAPIIHVQHDSLEANSALRVGQPGHSFQAHSIPQQGEAVFNKNVNSAFIGTGLSEYLQDNNHNHLVVAGLTTDHCVSTSVRMAGNLGFKVNLVGDACATYDRRGPDGILYKAADLHHYHLASLHGEFCGVITATQANDLLSHQP